MNDAAALKRKFMIVVAIDVVCFLVAAAAMVGYVTAHVAALGPVFVAAIAVGVSAQVWFIVAFARMGAAAKNASAKA